MELTSSRGRTTKATRRRNCSRTPGRTYECHQQKEEEGQSELFLDRHFNHTTSAAFLGVLARLDVETAFHEYLTFLLYTPPSTAHIYCVKQARDEACHIPGGLLLGHFFLLCFLLRCRDATYERYHILAGVFGALAWLLYLLSALAEEAASDL